MSNKVRSASGGTNQTKLSKFFINGMHCASCEILIEKRLIKEDSVEMVDCSLKKGELVIEHDSKSTYTPEILNKMFKDDGYKFSKTQFSNKQKRSIDNSGCAVPTEKSNFSFINHKSNIINLSYALLFVVAFILLNRTGFASLVSVNTTSGLPLFFLFGLLAGFSSCAALVGGIVLSLSRQWLGNYTDSDSLTTRLTPHFLFNIGRVLGYAFLGAVLGYVGNFFRLSPVLTASMVILVSLFMVAMALQMLGFKAFANFQIRLPKFLTGRLADESNFQGRFAPPLMGAFTFFLPCGFTITAQALALASGSLIQGALIMGLFALGTVPGLLAIGVSSVKMYSNPARSAQFSVIAGLIVLFFALFNFNSQLAVLGAPNLSDLYSSIQNPPVKGEEKGVSSSSTSLVPIIKGKQVVKTLATSFGYSPDKYRLRAGQPIRWEITANGVSGCTNAVISRSLFPGQIDLVNGTTSIKEFTAPTKPGIYKFSCWMGMVVGSFEVVDDSGSAGAAVPVVQESGLPVETVVESGAKGCGCGGGAGSCGQTR